MDIIKLSNRRRRRRQWPALVAFIGVAPTAVADTFSWDPDGALPVSGGSGQWDASSPNWWNGAAHVPWDNAGGHIAAFDGAGGTIILGAGTTARGLFFDAPGYTLIPSAPSGNLTLTNAGSGFLGPQAIRVRDHTVTIMAPIVADALVKTDNGSLVLQPSMPNGLTYITGTLDIQQGQVTIDTTHGEQWLRAAVTGPAILGSLRKRGDNLLTITQPVAAHFRLSGPVELYAPLSGGVSVAAGELGTLRWATANGSTTINGPVSVNGTLRLAAATLNTSMNLAGGVSGFGTLLVDGGPAFPMRVAIGAGSGTWSGTLAIGAGTVSAPVSALPAGNVIVGAQPNGVASDVTLRLSGTLTKTLGTGPGQIQFATGIDGTSPTPRTRTLGAAAGGLEVNLGNNGSTVPWGSPGFWAENTMWLDGGDAGDGLTWRNPINLGPIPNMREVHVAGAGPVALTGALSGGAGLVKTGPGTLVLRHATNEYFSPTVVQSGTLVIDHNESIPATSPLRFSSGDATVRVTTSRARIPSIQIPEPASGTPGAPAPAPAWSIEVPENFDVFELVGDLDYPKWNTLTGGALTINGRMTFPFNSGTHTFRVGDNAPAADVTINAVIEGQGPVRKTDDGVLVMRGRNTFGRFYHAGGSVRVAGNSGFQGGIPFGPLGSSFLTLEDDVTLTREVTGTTAVWNLANRTFINGRVALGGIELSGPIELGDATRTIVPLLLAGGGGANDSAVRLSGTISGAPGAGINFDGSGSVELLGVNTFTGPVTLGRGSLHVSNPLALGSTDAGTTVQRGGNLHVRAPLDEPILADGAAGSTAFSVPRVWGSPVASLGRPLEFRHALYVASNTSGVDFRIGNEIVDLTGGAGGTLTIATVVEATRVRAGTLDLGSSRLRLAAAPAAAHARVSVVRHVAFDVFSGRLDLTNNALVWDYDGASPLTTVTEKVASAYAAGTWTGPGFTTSLGDAAHGVAYAEAAAIGSPVTFLGEPIDATAVLLRYARYGDANLDGTVTLQDFNRLAAHFGATAGAVWSDGDFNYDGSVNLIDFNRLAANFGLGAAGPDVTPDDWAALASAVPEPSAAGVVALGVSMLARRRSRRREGSAG